MIEKEAKRYNGAVAEASPEEALDGVLRSIWAGAAPTSLASRLTARSRRGRSWSASPTEEPKDKPTAEPGVIAAGRKSSVHIVMADDKVRGYDDLLTYLGEGAATRSDGEQIRRHITRAKGGGAQRERTNVKNLMVNPDREIEVEWAIAAEQVPGQREVHRRGPARHHGGGNLTISNMKPNIVPGAKRPRGGHDRC